MRALYTRRNILRGLVTAAIAALLIRGPLNAPLYAAAGPDPGSGSVAKGPAAPTDLKAHWAGTDPNGRAVGVVLTWNAVPGATSYNVYSGSQVVPQPLGETFLLQRGVKDTFFIDGAARVGIDTIPFYQVTAVNAAGESPKSNKAQPSAPAVELPVVIQGTVVPSNGKTILVKTPDHGLDCPPNTPCPAIAIVGVTYAVDLSRALYEAPDGTPVATPKLTKGQAVVVVGHKDPSLMSGTRHPLLLAQVVELVVVSPGVSPGTTLPPTTMPNH
ncbi:MAG: hypothetical protein JO316_10160 [Abitibacteriaceae bacterium]|nr:hypothetical protein [Abditibacteriaceae bacterium]